jgi:Uma2 family endonuclease
MAPIIQVTSANYPESDGRPMGETDQHRKEMIRQLEILTRFFAGQRVYVSGNLLVYYEQGSPKKFVVPDVFVVKGLEPKDRRVYRLWVEGQAPDVIIETTSRKKRKQDTVTKPALYALLRVKEYFLFDPTQDYLDPPLQGYRLQGERYVPIDADSQGSLVSAELGLRLQAEHGTLMACRLDTGEPLLTAEQARQVEADGRRAEAAARQAAEAEVARLREDLRRRL